jgi:triosephosphate isomerase
MNHRRPLLAGNWKMNLDIDGSVKLVESIAEETRDFQQADVLVAPPFTAIPAVRRAIGDSRIFLGAQNMHWEREGAYTGEISGNMLKEAGCTHVILGHSERRILFNETSELIDLKVNAAVSHGLIPILCVGETLEQREAGQTFDVIQEQLDLSLHNSITGQGMPYDTTLAYEPVWAIGTGRTATPDQAQEVHKFIRQWIERVFNTQTANRTRILYGGSVKPQNIANLMSEPDIDGALVGGASLKAEAFLQIIRFDKNGSL